tara:strand:+ start:424 stop:957 length:534 start_codon:yes stop_codon:yes gene_type:complete
MVIWITGLSGAGKTTLSTALLHSLKPALPQLLHLDGDTIRSIFGEDLNYSEAHRKIQIKRIQQLAKFLSDQAAIILVSALYSHPDLLAWNRANLTDYFEIYLRAPIELVKERDTKSLYAKAEAGKIENVVGIDIPWNVPIAPDLVIDATNDQTPEQVAQQIVQAVPKLAAAMVKRSE